MEIPPQDRLVAAVAAYEEAQAGVETARAALYSVIRDVAADLRQVDIVNATGWTREHIRQITRGGQPS